MNYTLHVPDGVQAALDSYGNIVVVEDQGPRLYTRDEAVAMGYLQPVVVVPMGVLDRLEALSHEEYAVSIDTPSGSGWSVTIDGCHAQPEHPYCCGYGTGATLIDACAAALADLDRSKS